MTRRGWRPQNAPCSTPKCQEAPGRHRVAATAEGARRNSADPNPAAPAAGWHPAGRLPQSPRRDRGRPCPQRPGDAAASPRKHDASPLEGAAIQLRAGPAHPCAAGTPRRTEAMARAATTPGSGWGPSLGTPKPSTTPPSVWHLQPPPCSAGRCSAPLHPGGGTVAKHRVIWDGRSESLGDEPPPSPGQQRGRMTPSSARWLLSPPQRALSACASSPPVPKRPHFHPIMCPSHCPMPRAPSHSTATTPKPGMRPQTRGCDPKAGDAPKQGTPAPQQGGSSLPVAPPPHCQK